MTCASCGAENRADARFCASCGHPTRNPVDERRVVTVVFADIVGFTTLSENLDPERVKRLVDVAFERLVRDVRAFGGRVDKIIGDAIVALFGAPVAHEDDAERAVRAALRMQATLADYAEESTIGIRMRIGVNTGEVLVGSLRAGGDYTAMGDVVNTASRLETSANPGEILVGPATYLATRDVIGYESRGSLIVRGRDASVDVWAATEALAPPGYRPRRVAPLVGRDTELSVLRHLIDLSTGHGRAQAVLLLGEAGVGKTRLANEIAPIVRSIDPTTTVLNGRCVPYGEANPWWPIAEALRESCSIDLDDPLDVARHKCRQAAEYVVGDPSAVPAVVAGLLHFMGYDGPLRSLDAARARAEATNALYVYLDAALRVRPVVIRLADLHWADQQVLDLIDELSERLARQPLVLVSTARRSLLERWSPRAGRQNALLMNLEPLDRSAASLLLDSLLADEVTDDVRAVLLDRSGGNPFYLEELATLLSERGSTDGDGDVPDTLRGLIAARLDALSPDERAVLEDASVWGSSGPRLALRELGRAVRGHADIDDLVDSLALKDIFVLDGDDWSFRSDVVREIAYSRLTKGERLRRHRGIAAYLETVSGGRFIDDGFVDTVSRHYAEAARLVRELEPSEMGQLDERALRWLGEAARRADQSASWPLAVRLYDQAVDLSVGEEHRGDRLAFLLGRARARNEMWNFGGARVDAEEAARLADELDDDVGRARVELLLGEIEAREGRHEEGDRHFDAAVARFDALDDVQSRAEALRLKGMAALYRSDALGAEDPIAQSLDAFRAVGDRRGEAWALQNLAWIAFVTGRVVEAEKRLQDAFAAFTEINDGTGLRWTEGLLAFVRFYQGRFSEASALASRIHADSEHRNDRWGQAMMLLVLGAIDLWEGRTESAVETAERSMSLFRSLGDPAGLHQALSLGGRARLMLGAITEGLDLVDRSVGDVDLDDVQAQHLLSLSSSVGARVQLGIDQIYEPNHLVKLAFGDGVRDRPAEFVASLALALAQAGQVDEAMALLVGDRGSLLDGGVLAGGTGLGALNGYGTSAIALVSAASGQHGVVDVVRAGIGADSTYLDRSFVAVAAALGRGPSWVDDLVAAEQETDGTADRLSRAVVALARATVAEAVGHDAALTWRDDAEARWAELGVQPVGWRRLFDAAIATTPAG